MSNFQRTRSKVWWGDGGASPAPASPAPASPAPAPRARWGAPARDDWEPQLPHWIANEPQPQKSSSADDVAAAVVHPWPRRHGSPGSHKSQDSGFSDSDSSPPASQYYPSPDKNDSKASKSSGDSNNNENITVRQAIDFQSTPGKDAVDASVDVSTGAPTPKPRLRSSSVIQTPYDLQKYYEVHNDQEHIELLKDEEDSKNVNNTLPKQEVKPAPRNLRQELTEKPKKPATTKSSIKISSNIEIRITPPTKSRNKENTPNLSAIEKETKVLADRNVNILSPSKKYPGDKPFVSSRDCTKISKVAVVKDLETSKIKSDESLQYLKLADNNEIAVNNQPRIRSPISNISYVPTERTKKKPKPEYRRSLSNEDPVPIDTTPNFQRNRLNKSLNFEAQRLDQQILDIQEGHHSLTHIDEEESVTDMEQQIHNPKKALLGKNIMDSLNLKPTKKIGPKSKQRMVKTDIKNKEQNGFKLFGGKKDKLSVVETHAGGILDNSRVPSLGLPRTCDQDSWVIVGYPEVERLIPNYNERLVESPSDTDLKSKDDANFDMKKVPPPPEFQDKPKKPYETDSKNDKDLTHDSKREKLKDDDMNFTDVQQNMACTSTPKMLAPHEFMNSLTPASTTKPLRVNLLDDFNRIVLDKDDQILYRERSIDQTALERMCDRKPEPVQYWLCDLVGACDNECMTTLQSKPLGAEVKALVASSSATITGNIRKVQTHGQIIVHQYSDVIKQIEANASCDEQICLLVANINEFVLAHSITLNTRPPGESPERWDKVKSSLQTYLQKLIDIGEDVKIELNDSCPQWQLVLKHLDALTDIFAETTRTVLVQQMKTLVSIIEEPPSDMIIKSTLTSVGHLAMLTDNTEGSLHERCAAIIKNITELPFVECGVPRALLTAIIETNKSSIKALSLRALATVCVSGDAVKQFEEGGGIEILSDILSDDKTPEPQKREAITVLTQITAPWLRGNYDLTQLHLYLNDIVKNITALLSTTSCCQLLLLCCACLNNLVRELELARGGEGGAGGEGAGRGDVVEALTRHRTVPRLLDAVKRRGPNVSVFLQEQTASLLSSLSRAPRCVLSLCERPAVAVALVCFTRAAPAHAPRDAELRARARLHAHAAEGIARLSAVPGVARQIAELDGVSHLARLARLQKTRPDNCDTDPDQTLVHCLKAIRTIHRHCPDAFEEHPKVVEEMVRPHLMESLMKFSAKRESYV